MNIWFDHLLQEKFSRRLEGKFKPLDLGFFSFGSLSRWYHIASKMLSSRPWRDQSTLCLLSKYSFTALPMWVGLLWCWRIKLLPISCFPDGIALFKNLTVLFCTHNYFNFDSISSATGWCSHKPWQCLHHVLERL